MKLGGSLSYSKNDVLERSPERLERWGPLLKKTKRAAARPAARPHTGAFYPSARPGDELRDQMYEMRGRASGQLRE